MRGLEDDTVTTTFQCAAYTGVKDNADAKPQLATSLRICGNRLSGSRASGPCGRDAISRLLFHAPILSRQTSFEELQRKKTE